MSEDQSTEQAIQVAGANSAQRVTLAEIEANIAGEYFFTGDKATAGCPQLPSLALLTFCVLVLRNGFTVTGESACASPENFNAEIGRRIARENAVAKVWHLLGFRLRDNLYNLANGPDCAAEWPEPSGLILTEADAAADLAGTPRPSRCTYGPNMGCTNCPDKDKRQAA